VTLALFFAIALVSAGPALASPLLEIEVFSRAGCPHCADAEAFLNELKRERPDLTVTVRRVDTDPQARDRLRSLSVQHRIAAAGVPAFYIRDQLIIGFLDEATTGQRLRALLDGAADESADQGAPACAAEEGGGGACEALPPSTAPARDEIESAFFGRLRASELGLPLFTIAIGLLDGFNPCAMWVLLFLLSMLVNMKSRKKMALVAGTFVVISGLAYFAFMAAWLNVFLFIGLSRGVQIALGLIAVVFGAINVKDFFAYKKGVSLSIPDSQKPGIYARVRAILRAEDLAGALSGVVVLAILVNMVELLCTAGFPAVYTQILTMHGLSRLEHYGYLALYNVAYMADDTLMVVIAVITLGHRKLTERGGRWLKLLSGAAMIGLAAILLLRPDLLAR
jgi:glutaredoxin